MPQRRRAKGEETRWANLAPRCGKTGSGGLPVNVEARDFLAEPGIVLLNAIDHRVGCVRSLR